MTADLSLDRFLGFPGTLIHGDTAVLDRWLWLRKRLPLTTQGEKAVDIGCGTGAFSIGAALRGYDVLGLSWNERNQSVARERADRCHARTAAFEVLDVRDLGSRGDLRSRYDVAICCETIEHILDDRKLVRDIADCLKPGGRLLLTTPSSDYRAITPEDDGPFSPVENGAHVRRGYTAETLKQLCDVAGLVVEETSFCTGVISQKLIWLHRILARVHPLLGWAAVLPLRPIPPLADRVITDALRWPYYSICIQASKSADAQPATTARSTSPQSSSH